MDEPLFNFDAKLRVFMRAEIAKIFTAVSEQQSPMLPNTRDWSCDSGGSDRAIMSATSQELLELERLTREQIGTPAHNNSSHVTFGFTAAQLWNLSQLSFEGEWVAWLRLDVPEGSPGVLRRKATRARSWSSVVVRQCGSCFLGNFPEFSCAC